MTKRTEKFNIAVKFGGAMLLPGTPVPVGGKDGLDDAEARRLHEAFGIWNGGPDANEGAEDDASAALAIVTEDRDRLAGEVDRLTAENSRVEGELAKARIAPSNRGDLDAEKKKVKVIEDEKKALETELASAREDIATLAEEIKRLTADLDEATKGKS
ncbi:hypothetical protein [Shinella sp. M31]|uniref:hypothetical protein n=1 Tax=Shinella sp. M31 TaxID=3368615 RepID=UPI003BA328B4